MKKQEFQRLLISREVESKDGEIITSDKLIQMKQDLERDLEAAKARSTKLKVGGTSGMATALFALSYGIAELATADNVVFFGTHVAGETLGPVSMASGGALLAVSAGVLVYDAVKIKKQIKEINDGLVAVNQKIDDVLRQVNDLGKEVAELREDRDEQRKEMEVRFARLEQTIFQQSGSSLSKEKKSTAKKSSFDDRSSGAARCLEEGDGLSGMRSPS